MGEENTECTIPANECNMVWKCTRPKNMTTYDLSRRLKRRSEYWIQTVVLDTARFLVDASRVLLSFVAWLNELHG